MIHILQMETIKTFFHLVYPFTVGRKLRVWMATRIGQKFIDHLLAVCKTFLQEIMSSFANQEVYYGVEPQMLVNMG